MTTQQAKEEHWSSQVCFLHFASSLFDSYPLTLFTYPHLSGCLTRENAYNRADRFLQAYQNSASFVPKLAGKVIGWLDVQEHDQILDIGCGGESSRLIIQWL